MGDIQHPDVQEKINDSISRIIAGGRNAGALATNENVARYTEMGVRFFMTGAGPWIANGFNEFVTNANAAK
jgi:2-keto-3-deoxy-L-rhamnonate aldolase RhmA